ncbi:hypothetical protein QJS10_CPA09g00202 [Acorus calamus]|uniref:Uncharacterized protein n=1 Tax=Acorus calamus TaxID=4465 RepID=A0AAV9E4Y4_ACOCL|nr:hypothetical protein QJS10_CPA09g00202 [Acorus calamus]
MEALFNQFSTMSNQTLTGDNPFNPYDVDHLLHLFELEAYNSWSSYAAASHASSLAFAAEAESSIKAAESDMDALLASAMDEFHRTVQEAERLSESETRGLVRAAEKVKKAGESVGSAASVASKRYLDGAVASATATMRSAFGSAGKIKKIYPC